MKNRSVNILIVGLLLLVIMSVILVVFVEHAHGRFKEDITVSENGVTESVKTVRGLKLNPTESKEYRVNLLCKASGDYYIYIDYTETHDGGMKKFVNATVSLGDTVLYSGSLADLLDTDAVIEFVGTLEEEDPLPIVFHYEMPREIGNEAQGTSSDFDIEFKIVKK